MDFAFCVISKESLLSPRSQRFSPMFSLKSFIVSGLAFRSFIHLDLNFVCDVMYGSVHVFEYDCPVVTHWSKINWTHMCGSNFGISVLFHWFMYLSFYQYHTVD